MGVAGEGHVLGSGAEFHGDADLVDEIARHGPDDMRAKDAIGFLVDEEFDEPVGGEVGLGPAIAHEGELAGLVGAALFLELLLGLADGGDLGVGVDHAGDDAVIHVTVLARDDASGGHALVLGLVGQHGTRDTVADGVDALDVGLPVVVGLDLAALGHLDAKAVEAQPVGERLAPRGNQHHVGIERFLAVVLAQLVGDLGLGFHRFDALNGGAHDGVQALFLEHLVEVLLHFAIHAGGDMVEIFHDRHLGPKAGIDRAQFQPDDAGADDDQFLGHLGQFQRAGGGDDGFLVDLDAR